MPAKNDKVKLQLSQVRGVPYRCGQCGNIMINTVERSGTISNCDRRNCESDDVCRCGPSQVITLIIYQHEEPTKPRRKVRG